MNLLFIAPLMAAPAGAEGAPAQGSSMSMIIMMVLIFAVMYFFMIRPQQKRQKELLKFRNELKVGDKVITAGGIYGTIRTIEATVVVLDVDSTSTIRVDKTMIMKDLSDIQQTK